MPVASLELLVLDLLSDCRPAYGLELVARSRGRLKRGSVYVTLGRMEEKGLVRSRLEAPAHGGPPRRLYESTALGRRALVAGQLAQGRITPAGALRALKAGRVRG